MRTKTWELRFAQLVKLVENDPISHRAVRLESLSVRYRLTQDGAQRVMRSSRRDPTALLPPSLQGFTIIPQQNAPSKRRSNP